MEKLQERALAEGKAVSVGDFGCSRKYSNNKAWGLLIWRYPAMRCASFASNPKAIKRIRTAGGALSRNKQVHNREARRQ
ncbi:MAG: hypothetical protein H6968_19490 [Chromatiaceae bacterium]|nr:hypothetical protein [Chromatiaceae bacterium]